MFKKILCSVDFSEVSSLALIAALPIADRCGATIHIAHVLTHRVHQQDSAVDGTGIEYHRRMYSTRLDDLVSRTVPDASHEVLVGESVSEELLKCARAKACDLIVIGSHARTAVGEVTMGSTTEELLRLSEIPVLLIRKPIYRSTARIEFQKILVGVDFSDMSLNALTLAMRFAAFLNGELHIVHVVDTHSLALKEMHSRLARFLEEHGYTGTWSGVVLYGNTVNEIVEYATRKNCDFVFMGTQGKTAVERLLLGSNSRGVLDRLHLPLVMVPHLFRMPFKASIAESTQPEPA